GPPEIVWLSGGLVQNLDAVRPNVLRKARGGCLELYHHGATDTDGCRRRDRFLEGQPDRGVVDVERLGLSVLGFAGEVLTSDGDGVLQFRWRIRRVRHQVACRGDVETCTPLGTLLDVTREDQLEAGDVPRRHRGDAVQE